jgi:hypothetical protein
MHHDKPIWNANSFLKTKYWMLGDGGISRLRYLHYFLGYLGETVVVLYIYRLLSPLL